MDPKKLRKQYMQLLPGLQKTLGHVNSQLSDLPPSEFLLETNMKPYKSIRRKMEAEHIKHPSQLSDLVRGRIFFSDQFQYEDTLDILKKIFGQQISKVEKKTDKGHGLQYCGVVHVDMNIDGVNFELQLMPMEFKPFKQFLHQIYEKFRSPKEKEKLSDKQQEFLQKVHNNLYKKLEAKSKANRGG